MVCIESSGVSPHRHTHTRTHRHAQTHTHTHGHTPIVSSARHSTAVRCTSSGWSLTVAMNEQRERETEKGRKGTDAWREKFGLHSAF